jgi:hypothetical protein
LGDGRGPGAEIETRGQVSSSAINPLYLLDRLTKKRKLLKKWREGPVADWELHPLARKRVNADRSKSMHKIF